jgi:hypothetical protein
VAIPLVLIIAQVDSSCVKGGDSQNTVRKYEFNMVRRWSFCWR